MERKLAAILAADLVGYSRLVGRDEVGTLAALHETRSSIIDPLLARHGGRIVKTMGDGLLLEFGSAVKAVECAVEIQRDMAPWSTDKPADRRMVFRIGVHLGDVVVDSGDLLGDGVNIAARLEAIADPGGICLSAAVVEQVRDRLGYGFEDMGDQTLKNIARPVPVFRVARENPGSPVETSALPFTARPAVAVLPFDNMSGDPAEYYFVDGLTEDIIT